MSGQCSQQWAAVFRPFSLVFTAQYKAAVVCCLVFTAQGGCWPFSLVFTAQYKAAGSGPVVWCTTFSETDVNQRDKTRC